MTFEEVLTQSIAMLQRLGRVSYRTLKVQCQLDDDLPEILNALGTMVMPTCCAR